MWIYLVRINLPAPVNHSYFDLVSPVPVPWKTAMRCRPPRNGGNRQRNPDQL